MKKNIHSKLFGLTLTAALALTTLGACGSSVETAALPSPPARPPLSRRRTAAALAPCS